MSRPGRGRPPSEPEDARSKEERQEQRRADDAERQQRKRSKDKAEEERQGIYRRKPGRPKKAPKVPTTICGLPVTPPLSPNGPPHPQ
jgi:hypothetical protein